MAPKRRGLLKERLIPFLVVLLLAVILFYRHLYPYLEPRLGPAQATLLAAVPIAISVVWQFLLFLTPKEEIERLPARLLRLVTGPPPAILWSVVALLFVALLCITSVCISLKGDTAGAGIFKVHLERDHKLWLASGELSVHSPSWIGFTLPAFPPQRLDLTAVDVRTQKKYPTLREDLVAGAALQVYLPEDLAPQLHVINLLPWFGLLENLPSPSEPRDASDPCRDSGQPPTPGSAVRGPSDRRYRLECTIVTKTGQYLYTIADLRKQSIYLGASRDALISVSEPEYPKTRLDRMPAATDSDPRIGWATQLLANTSPCVLPTVDLEGGESLRISLVAMSQHESVPVVVGRPFTVATTPGVQNIYLGVP